MSNETTPQEATTPETPYPQWLEDANPIFELYSLIKDVFQNSCSCDICTRIRKISPKLDILFTPPEVKK